MDNQKGKENRKMNRRLVIADRSATGAFQSSFLVAKELYWLTIFR